MFQTVGVAPHTTIIGRFMAVPPTPCRGGSMMSTIPYEVY